MIQLPIIVDTNDIVDTYSSLTPENVDTMLNNIAKGLAASFASQLISNAEQALHSTRSRYINNIKVIDSGKFEGTVLLDYSKDKLVKMIEEGASAFDMKEGFLASAKVKIGKNGGKYLTIPFRQATPNAIAESNVFAFRMSAAVYNIVKNKPVTIPVSGGGMRSAGLSLKELPDFLQKKQKRPEIKDQEGNPLFKEYEHKTATAVGISKYQDPATKQNTYRSFRSVSEKSDPEAFIHKGIEKYNLIAKTLSQFNTGTEMGMLIDNELKKLGLL